MDRCPHCGVKIEQSTKFCGECGQPVVYVQTVKPKINQKEHKGYGKNKVKPTVSGKKSKLYIIIILIALLAVIALAAVFGILQLSKKTGEKGAGEKGSVGALYENAKELMLQGDDFAESGLLVLAEYCYSEAGAAISSLRFAVDNILYLKGEGETLSDVIGFSAYADWDTVGRICISSAYPYYFEGLLYQMQGKNNEAEALYNKATMNPACPHAEEDFYLLKNESTEELYTQRERLISLETEIYSRFTPKLWQGEREGYEFSADRHKALAREARARKDSQSELSHYRDALRADPTVSASYGSCAVAAMENEDSEAAVQYLIDGLMLDETDAALNYLAAVMALSAENPEDASEYIKIALEDPNISSDLKKKCEALKNAIKGGV